MKLNIVLLLGFCLSVVHYGFGNPSYPNREDIIKDKYTRIDFAGNKPSYEAFYKAMKGYMHLSKAKELPNVRYFTIIDFTMSSNLERLWIIDMENLQVVYNTVVSHGRNTGDEFANNFSNILNSGMSSIGFYVTAETYFGKHGFSLRLKGLDAGFNDNAYSRAIVMHSADYATPDFAKRVGRLGRSLGCPAIPPAVHKEIIELIKEGTLMFIFFPDQEYLENSRFLL